ncbi:MAG TPA: ATP-dependent DNA ligase [Roseiflexaceae bacterium]|nr:ATP-dependent DNA ligase [Roseiflexaceae bacterium]
MLFHTFAETCERLAATSSRLAKAEILRDYLAALDDSDLPIAARFFTGRPFALADERVLNVGWALVRDAVCALSGMSTEEFGQLATTHGEAGAAAGVALRGHVAQTPTLTLRDVADAFAALAAARGPTQKRPLLEGLLRRATPLEAAYVIKIIDGDLRIGLQEGLLEEGLARAAGVPVGQVQWANMLLGDVGETALLARYGRLGEARMRLFHPLKFMLASPIQDPEEIRRSIDGPFFVEDKYDGIRAQVHRQGERLAIYSRTFDEVTKRFPELHTPLLALPGEFIMDGEILAARAGRILPFKELQVRLGRKTVSDDVLAAAPVIFVAFDLLYQDGAVLLETPLAERRERLERLAGDRGLGTEDRGPRIGEEAPITFQNGGVADRPVILSRLVRCEDVADIEPLFKAARGRGNEGLMVKDPRSPYRPGRRGREWLKFKKALATLDVVVTAVEVGHGRRRNVLSDYTFAVRASEDDPTLLTVGKASSGLSDAEIAALTKWCKEHTIRDLGRVRLVEPKVVLEVAFDVVQPSTRYKSGYALRFPRIVRIREDKPVDEIDTLETVRRLAEGGDRHR